MPPLAVARLDLPVLTVSACEPTHLTRSASARPAQRPVRQVLPLLPPAFTETQGSNSRSGCDAVTGLPTRREFAAQLQDAVQQARSSGRYSSVMLIDLEGLQKIVAQHGQKTGDKALGEIARRLEVMLKKSEMLARLGDEEFAVIAEGRAEAKAHRDMANRLARRMVYNIRQPVAANDAQLRFNASIGIALCRAENADGQALLQTVADATRQAKSSAAGFGLAEPAQADASPPEDAAIERDLLQALAAGEIIPYYQPVIELAAQKISGFEALARWRHPIRGLVPPDLFIPILEGMGMMPELTDSILRQVCRDLRCWPLGVHVAINVSPSELSDPQLPRRILWIAEQEDIPPERLVIEVTETALVQDIAVAKASLHTFRQAGIMTALDDFGTGYASLGQLQQLKFDCLKIDRSFVQSMLANNNSEKIVDAILGLARSLNLQVIAEGIETAGAVASLTARGCDFGQGYYYSQAVTADEARELLKTGVPRLNAA